jgi:hypothetical protein
MLNVMQSVAIKPVRLSIVVLNGFILSVVMTYLLGGSTVLRADKLYHFSTI